MEGHMNFSKSHELQKKSHAIIPGGAHTYAKGDDQFPEEAPAFIDHGSGCHVWDVDGNEFIEYGMGLRSVTLGHGYRSIVEAAYREMQRGINFTRPAAIEIECAESLLSMIDGAEMVKFGKNGSDATSAAVKLARSYTGRNLVGICHEHPFFSVDDWFIGSTEMPAGIPQAYRDLTVQFHFNNLDSVRELFAKYPGQIACLIMEAERLEAPRDNFLQETLRICHENGALFILDEIITGFRWHVGGAQKVYGVVPDMSTFGKALSNGFSLSALVGKREFMEAGGINHNRERVFLLSLTYGAETHHLAAAIETMRIYKTEPVVEHLHRQGAKLAEGVRQLVAQKHLEGYFGVDGRACNLIYYTRDDKKQPSQPFRTLFLQELIKHGIIAPSFLVSYSHSDADIQHTIEALDPILDIYARALDEGVEKYLIGRPVKPVMRPYC
jgi:glutamate-1-semialdehyde 2,1-aminomutase